MIKIGSLTLGGTPRVALSVKDRVPPSILRKAKQLGVDLVECRIDQYASFEAKYVVNEVKKIKGLPKIATIRLRREGGKWSLAETARLNLFKAVMPCVDAVDIELSAKEILPDLIREARRRKKIVIVSCHNFKKTPADAKLRQVLQQGKKLGAGIVKIATLVHRRKDLQRLASFTIAHAGKNLICIGMGAQGTSTRLLFPGVGSLITYTHMGQPTAPGQIDCKTTLEFLKKMYPKES